VIVFFAGLIASIPLSILANIATPYVADYWARWSQGRKEKRIDKLVTQLARVARYHEDRSALAAFLAVNIVILMVTCTLTVTVFLINIAVKMGVDDNAPLTTRFGDTACIITLFALVFMASQLCAIYINVVKISVYVEKMKKRCGRLGIAYEDLDKAAQQQVDRF
jgi:hypothetical protein